MTACNDRHGIKIENDKNDNKYNNNDDENYRSLLNRDGRKKRMGIKTKIRIYQK